MMNKKLFDVLYKISGAGAVLSILGMIAAVFVQVFARFLLDSSPGWTEEMARIFFIYAVAFGAGPAVRNNDYVRLELIERYLSEKGKRSLQSVILLVSGLFFLALVYYAWQFVLIGLPERSPSLETSMGLVFISIFMAFLFILLFTVERLLKPNRPT